MTGSDAPARTSDAALCVALTALWAAFWWPLVSGAERLFARDLSTFAGPAKYYWRERVAAGELPAWIASVDAGSPFLADVAYQALYPPNLLFLLDLPLAVGISWFIALHFLAGLLGVYALARVLGAVPLLAGWAAGVFALCGYPLGVSDNITYVAGVAWAPCMLAAFFVGMRRASVRWLVLASVPLAFMLLAGDLLDAAVACCVCAAYALALSLRAWREHGLRRAAWLLALAGLVPLLAVAVSGAQVLPTLELLPLSKRAQSVPEEMRKRWSLPPVRLIELLHPFVFGIRTPVLDYLTPHLYPAYGEPWVESIYLGPVVIGCAVAALFLRARVAAGWLLLALTALLLSMTGHFQVLLDLTAQLPVLSRQRYFEKLVLWASIALLPLAVLGAQALLSPRREPLPRRGIGRFALTALVLISLWLTLDVGLGALPEKRLEQVSAYWSSRLPIAVTHVGGPILHLLLWLPLLAACLMVRGHARRVLVGVALAATLLDLFWVHHGRYLSAPAALVSDDREPETVREILAFDTDALGTGRVYFDEQYPGPYVMLAAGVLDDRVKRVWAQTGQPDTRNYIPIYHQVMLKERLSPNYGIEFGVRYLNGAWSPLRLARTVRQEAEMLASDPLLWLAAGGVRWVVTAEWPPNRVWGDAGFEQVLAREDINLRLMRAPHAAPRAWLSSREDVAPMAFDYLHPAGDVQVLEDEPERLRFEVQADARARWLVVGESLMPGWRARVDGEPVPMSEAHGRFMGLPVTAGRHEVVIEYHVPGLAMGTAVSVVGLLCALMLLVLGPRPAPVSEGRARDG